MRKKKEQKELKQEEYEIITEFSYNAKQTSFVVRFLSGEVYALDVNDLPKKMITKKPDWEHAQLSGKKGSLIYTAGAEKRQIEGHIIHSRGKLL